MKRKKIDEDETRKRKNKAFLAIKFITEASELLYFSIKARYTATVISHKYVNSFELIPLVVASCNLSSKINEQNKDLKQIIYTINYLVSVYECSSFSQCPVISYSEYVGMKEKAIEVELEILLDNNFDIQVVDLYKMFFEKRVPSGEGGESSDALFEKYFYRLNSVLLSHSVFYLSPFNIFNLIEDDDLYEGTLEPLRDLMMCIIDLKTFECRSGEVVLDKSLLKKFLKRK